MAESETGVHDVSNIVIGAAALGAVSIGWSEGEAALIGLRAREGASGRVAAGRSMDEAFADAVNEAEMVLIMDRFAKALTEKNDVGAAFDAAIAPKRAASVGAPGVEAAIEAARAMFVDAVTSGLAPHAALLSAFITGAATMRKAAAV